MKNLRIPFLIAISAILFGGQTGNAAPPEHDEHEKFDLAALQLARDPETLLKKLDDDMREDVEESFGALVLQDSDVAAERNKKDLYPNPSLQAYVNQLGQSLIPALVSENTSLSFKILEDPFPYADSHATGTIYLSSGLVSLLDNESQLAFVLMHEAAHVVLHHHLQQVIEEKKAEDRSKKLKFIGTAAGAVAGALGVGGGGRGKELFGAAGGLLSGKLADSSYRSYRNRRFMRENQFEADRFAIEALLLQGFDTREAPTLLARLSSVIKRSGAAVDLAFGTSDDLSPRATKISQLVATYYKASVDGILAGSGFRISSPRYSQLMAELKRDNGLLALNRDLYAIARSNLEEAALVRTDDPITMYGLGMLYRAIGRTAEDHAKASGFLKSAMEFDEVRHRFPHIYLEYAVELLSREDPRYYPEIQAALKTFVVLFQRQSGGQLPREMNYVYDYLDLSGDRSWISYNVNNVNANAPYQQVPGRSTPSEGASTESESASGGH